MKTNHWLILGATGLVAVVALLGLTLARPYSLHGSELSSPKLAPEIALTNSAGQPFRLSDQKGKLVLLFFGYTSCPDVCPTILAEMKQIHESLGKEASQVDFVFVTVDPNRDVPERLSKYLAQFDPTFIGISSTQAQLEPVWKAYGVSVGIPDGQNMNANYSVNHSTYTYLIDRQGRLRLIYDYGTPQEQIEQDIRYLLRKD